MCRADSADSRRWIVTAFRPRCAIQPIKGRDCVGWDRQVLRLVVALAEFLELGNVGAIGADGVWRPALALELLYVEFIAGEGLSAHAAAHRYLLLYRAQNLF